MAVISNDSRTFVVICRGIHVYLIQDFVIKAPRRWHSIDNPPNLFKHQFLDWCIRKSIGIQRVLWQTMPLYLMSFDGAFTLLALCKSCANKNNCLSVSSHLISYKFGGGLNLHLLRTETERIVRDRIAFANNAAPKWIFQFWRCRCYRYRHLLLLGSLWYHV